MSAILGRADLASDLRALGVAQGFPGTVDIGKAGPGEATDNDLVAHGAGNGLDGFEVATDANKHQIGRADPGLPLRASVRWTLHGKHEGYGAFGPPTGANVYVLGATHAEFGALVGDQPKLRREWTLIDETAIWKQILLQTELA